MKRNEMKDKTEYFFKNNIKVHIETKDKLFFNGMIIEIYENYCLIKDRYLGKMPLAFSEMNTINQFIEQEGE